MVRRKTSARNVSAPAPEQPRAERADPYADDPTDRGVARKVHAEVNPGHSYSRGQRVRQGRGRTRGLLQPRRMRRCDRMETLNVFAATHPSEAVLDEYANAIKLEADVARRNRDFGRGRVFKFARKLAAPRSEVWAFWTTGRLVRRWWSPEHFEVVRARVEPVAGGRLEIVMQEGDGTLLASRGRFIEVEPPKHLRFELGPIGPDSRALLTAVHDLTLAGQRRRTNLVLSIRVTSATQAAVPALAGLELGWRQLLDKLERTVGSRSSRIGSEQRGT
jgi:uncharacterized protein YndB with AHSA1/START domain